MNPVPAELTAIAAIEDSFVAAIQACPVAPYLAQVATIPADMSAAEVQDRLRKLPAVFVAFDGGEARDTRSPGLDARFALWCVTGQGAIEEQRRRGSKVTIGAYAIAQALMFLHGKPLPVPSAGGTPVPGLTIGAPYMASLYRLFSDDTDFKGLTIYHLVMALGVDFPRAIDVGGLADFLRFDGEIALDGKVPDGSVGEGSLPLPIGAVSSEDTIILPNGD